jgi:hypothetical protein
VTADPFRVAAHTIEPWGGGPQPSKGDYVWVRGIYVGPDKHKPGDDCVVDLFSSNTQYPAVIRQDNVVFYGPDWWPPQEQDTVITEVGEVWRFLTDGNDEMWAYTVPVPGKPAPARMGAGPGDEGMWRGTWLVARGGKRVDW